MNPLTVTWSPIMYTDYGYKNFINWCDIGGFDNISFKQNGIVVKKTFIQVNKKSSSPISNIYSWAKKLCSKIG